MEVQKNLIIVILAAGKGKRMLSDTPKAMHKILDKPMIHYVLKEAYLLNPRKVFVVTGFGHEELEAYLNEKYPSVQTVFQEKQLGTGHAVNVVRKFAEPDWEDVMVLPGDSPLIRSKTLNALHDCQQSGKHAAAVLSAQVEDPAGYGRIIRNKKGELLKIIEEADANLEEKKIKEINSSIYCFDSSLLFKFLSELSPDNLQNEFYLPDVIEKIIISGQTATVFTAEKSSEIFGVNDRFALAEAAKRLQRRINEELMLSAGVSMPDPDSVYIGDEVLFSQDVIIYPNTFIFGKTRIESGCIIGPSVQLSDCFIGKNTIINTAVLKEVKLGENNNVGPFTYIRPGTITDNNVKIGGFCEVKKSTIGKNSKIPHLTYIGDTEMGQNVNIGASSVTCNYNGYEKNKTIIGNNVFIGSDTMLIPPIKIGNGAIVAAGSAITENVPDNALALARGRQVNIEDGAKKYRAKKEIKKNEGANK